jgi:hypothetical protein
MKIDTRTFTHAGSSADPNGSYKARFANGGEARPKVLAKLGHTNFVLVALPKPMTKLEAIAYLKEVKPEGVNLASLDAKETYVNTQIAKINGTFPKRKRGRPAKNRVETAKIRTVVSPTEVVTPVTPPESIVKTIVNTARGTSIRAKAARAANAIAKK